MTTVMQEWRETAFALQKVHEAKGAVEEPDLVERLADLWLLLNRAPEQVCDIYRKTDDAKFRDVDGEMEDALVEGSLIWEMGKTDKLSVENIGRQLRALDSKLTTLPRFTSPPISQTALLAPRADIFVIPRGRVKDADRPAGPSNTIYRRATPNHSIIPREFTGGYTVSILIDSRLSLPGPVKEPIKLGAALFPNEIHKWDESGSDGATIEKVDCGNDIPVMTSQVTKAFEQPMFAAVWPELSMSPARLAELQARMKSARSAAQPLYGPVIVAAGSWHENINGKIHNKMRLLDRNGVERGSFTKITKFFGGGEREGNDPAKELLIVWNHDALVSFAICSDFCDTSDPPPPFLKLDVDVLLVPSLANAKALKGHEANVDRRSNIGGGSTFVVQQNLEEKTPVGWVLPRDEAGNCEENEIWATRDMELK